LTTVISGITAENATSSTDGSAAIESMVAAELLVKSVRSCRLFAAGSPPPPLICPTPPVTKPTTMRRRPSPNRKSTTRAMAHPLRSARPSSPRQIAAMSEYSSTSAAP